MTSCRTPSLRVRRSNAKKGFPLITLLFATLSLYSIPLGAAESNDDRSGQEDLPASGLHGSLQVLIGAVVATTAQADEGDHNRTISNLYESADSETSAFPGVLWELQYTLGDRHTQFFLSAPDIPLETGDSLIEVGASYFFDGGMVITGAYAPRIKGLDGKAWKDPYLTYQPRQRTTVQARGYRFSVKNIFSLPISAAYNTGQADFEDDHAGLSLLNAATNPLSAQDIDDLRRDAAAKRVTFSSMVPFSKTLFLLPWYRTTRYDADGTANRFDRSGWGGSLIYKTDVFTSIFSGAYENSEYDIVHPVFQKIRKNKIISTNLIVSFSKPFNWEADLNIIVNHSERDSNIDFYSNTSNMLALGFVRTF